MLLLLGFVIVILLIVSILISRKVQVRSVFTFFGIYGAMIGIYTFTEYGLWYISNQSLDKPQPDKTLRNTRYTEEFHI